MVVYIREKRKIMKRIMIIIFCILGMIVGTAVAGSTAGVSALRFLSIGGEIGIKTPIVLDLHFLEFTIGFWIKVTVGGGLGLVLFGFLAKVILDWLRI